MTYEIANKYLMNEWCVVLLPEQSSPSQERSVCLSSSQRTLSHDLSIITYTQLVVDDVVMQVAHKQPGWVSFLFFLHTLYISIVLLQTNP